MQSEGDTENVSPCSPATRSDAETALTYLTMSTLGGSVCMSGKSINHSVQVCTYCLIARSDIIATFHKIGLRVDGADSSSSGRPVNITVHTSVDGNSSTKQTKHTTWSLFRRWTILRVISQGDLICLDDRRTTKLGRGQQRKLLTGRRHSKLRYLKFYHLPPWNSIPDSFTSTSRGTGF